MGRCVKSTAPTSSYCYCYKINNIKIRKESINPYGNLWRYKTLRNGQKYRRRDGTFEITLLLDRKYEPPRTMQSAIELKRTQYNVSNKSDCYVAECLSYNLDLLWIWRVTVQKPWPFSQFSYIYEYFKDKQTQKALTSRCKPSKLAVPPFAHSTGKFIALPANATARADWPLPMTTTPANGRFSVCWHNDNRTFTENLKGKKFKWF